MRPAVERAGGPTRPRRGNASAFDRRPELESVTSGVFGDAGLDGRIGPDCAHASFTQE